MVSPVLMVIGLVYPNGTEEVLDSDWLARVANDQDYLIQTADSLVKNNMYPSGTAVGDPVWQSSQTTGYYYLSTPAGLPQAFQNVASQVMHLSQ